MTILIRYCPKLENDVIIKTAVPKENIFLSGIDRGFKGARICLQGSKKASIMRGTTLASANTMMINSNESIFNAKRIMTASSLIIDGNAISIPGSA